LERIGNSDSLKSILPGTSGQERVDLLNKIAYSVYITNPEETYRFAQQALELSDSLDYDQGKAVVLWLLSYREKSPDERLKVLYKAKKYLDDSTYWVVKYRIYSYIADYYSRTGITDSAITYFQKTGSAILLPDGFVTFMIFSNNKIDFYKKIGDFKNEKKTLKDLFNVIIKYGCPVSKKKYFLLAGKLGGYYTRHGYYKLAIETDKRILDSIDKFNFDAYISTFFKAKFLGGMARAYNHWGKYDSALIFHDSSILKFVSGERLYLEKVRKNDKRKVIMDWTINLANQIEGKAIVQMQLGMYDSSRLNFSRSMKIRKKKNDKLGVAMCLDGLGELCQVQGNYPKALEQLDEAIEIKRVYREEFNRGRKTLKESINRMIDESISISYFNKGKLFYDWGKYDMALEEFNKSLELCRAIEYVWGEATALLGVGDIFLKEDSIVQAKESYKKAYGIFIKTDNLPGKAQALAKLGGWFSHAGDTEQALEYYHKALSTFEDIGLQQEMAETYSMTAALHFMRKEYGEAISEYEKSVKIATPLKLTKYLMSSHKGLSDIYSRLGMTGKAFDHYKKYIAARDTLFTLEANKQIANLEAINSAEKKESELKVLKSENELKEYKLERSRYLLISVGGLAILLIILAVLYFRQEKLKVSQQNLTLEKKLLRTQMNPHFIFNALTNIQSFMFLNKPQDASRYLTTFAALIRNILENSKTNNVTLDKEIVTISNYMKLQKLRLGNKLDYSLYVDESIDTESILIPPMLAQPFIENAIEHGVMHKADNGKVDIKFTKNSNNYLTLVITDNGVGREKAAEIEKNMGKVHVSMATSITWDRLRVINKKKKGNITLDIIDLKDENDNPTGTKVVISIPVIYS
jgi:tetratricopeptide (TPR) repeat protein